jgi:hypothetical protein
MLSYISTLLGSLLFSTSILAFPTQVLNENAVNARDATPCSSEVISLASGISANIADQNNEVAAVTSLKFLLAESPINNTLFMQGQSSLLVFVQKGIDIRTNNQQIAPPGNAAIPGLAMVAMAQMEELNFTMSLGMGGVNLQRDNMTVTNLIADFNGGIEQNMKNLAAVCTSNIFPILALLT